MKRVVFFEVLVLGSALLACKGRNGDEPAPVSSLTVSGSATVLGQRFSPVDCRVGHATVNGTQTDIVWLADPTGSQLQLSGTNGQIVADYTEVGGAKQQYRCSAGSLALAGRDGSASASCEPGLSATVSFKGCKGLVN